MQLRGCSQLHFISVIMGAEVTKMPNISRGKSALKFKNVEHIYDFDGCQDSLQRIPPKVDRSLDMSRSVDDAKPVVKSECVDEECELDFGTTTLKQLKQACKSKKRKIPKSIILAAVKQEVSDLPSVEDELDLKETLVNWKRRVNKLKSKKKRTSICASASSEIDSFGCVSEDAPRSLAPVDISSEIQYPLQSKVQNPEFDRIQPQAISFVHSENNQNSTSEMPATVEYCSSDQALKFSEDPQGDYLNRCLLENVVHPKSVDTSQCVISYQISDVEHLGHDSTISSSSTCDDISMTEGSEVTDQPSVMCGSEMPREEHMNDFVTYDYHPRSCESEASTGEESLTTFLDESKYVVDEKELLAVGDTSTELQATDDSEEVARRSHAMDCIPTAQDSKVLLSSNCVASLPNTTFLVEDKHLSVDNSIADVMMPHPPERLFSARKIISPICQERLRKAMNFDEQQDDGENRSSKKVLLFEKASDRSSTSSPGIKIEQTISNSEGPETMTAIDVQAKGRKRMRKMKYEGKVPHSRSYSNGTRASQKPQNIGNICSSVQSCSQNAIAFSKQQIYDIERVAAKLMTGLQSMKSIVVDALQHESRTGTKFRYNTDQVRVAVENVGKVEETAQRWLSMMSRDCDRFCKIMSLAEADAPSPEKSNGENLSTPETKTTPKERKIMFADEAGGSLCNVKVFKKFEIDADIDTPFTC